jgi:teichuronic acid biosynthesis glycosyltransferase TuaG
VSQSNNPEISVVIPTHGGRFLEAAVESVQAQTVQEWELLIVDDGSEDGTEVLASELARRDDRIRVVRQARQGIAAARNRGLSAMSRQSGYVALLDHDDLWTPTTLEVLRDALLRNAKATAAHGCAISIDEEGRPIEVASPEGRLPWNRMVVERGEVRTLPLDRPTEFATLAYEDCIVSVGSALIRRAALDRIGGFDWRAEPADDYDLWVRLSRIGPIEFVNTVVLAYREHAGNRSLRAPPPRGRGTGYVRRKLITSIENTAEQRRIAIEGFRAHEGMLLRQRWKDIVATMSRREFGRLPRQAGAAIVRAASYVRGCPWWWQR